VVRPRTMKRLPIRVGFMAVPVWARAASVYPEVYGWLGSLSRDRRLGGEVRGPHPNLPQRSLSLRQRQEYEHCCYGKGVEDDLGLPSEPVENARTPWYTFGGAAPPRNPGQGPGS
jgi:hypothetical protein